MSYTEKDLPLHLKDGEMLTLDDGTTIRFEGNAEAKDIMVNEGFTPEVQLYPGCDYTVNAGGKSYKLTARFEDDVLVERI